MCGNDRGSRLRHPAGGLCYPASCLRTNLSKKMRAGKVGECRVRPVMGEILCGREFYVVVNCLFKVSQNILYSFIDIVHCDSRI